MKMYSFSKTKMKKVKKKNENILCFLQRESWSILYFKMAVIRVTTLKKCWTIKKGKYFSQKQYIVK